jgi:hypothetical protein
MKHETKENHRYSESAIPTSASTFPRALPPKQPPHLAKNQEISSITNTQGQWRRKKPKKNKPSKTMADVISMCSSVPSKGESAPPWLGHVLEAGVTAGPGERARRGFGSRTDGARKPVGEQCPGIKSKRDSGFSTG